MGNNEQAIKALIYQVFPNTAIKFWNGFWEEFKESDYIYCELTDEVDSEDNVAAGETVSEYILASFGGFVCREA